MRANIKPSIIFLVLALLVGGFIRFYFVLQADAPLNDGGLFYVMTRNLIANGFHLPLNTPYNDYVVPFTYPPLGFYLAGFLNQAFAWNLLDIFRILPAVFSTFSIFGFYWLAKDILKNDLQVGLATLIFSLIPSGFDWVILGGGVTRAPALLFFLLTAHFAYRLYTGKKNSDILLTALFAALTILSHPETSVHAAAVALVFFLFFGRTKLGWFRSGLVVLLTIGLTTPWWATVLAKHGFSPFLAAGDIAFSGSPWLFKFFVFDLTGEYYLWIIAVFALLGLFILIFKRQFVVPALFIAVFLAAPRSAERFLSPIVALLASETLLSFLAFLNLKAFGSGILPEEGLKSGLSKILLGFFLCVSVASSYMVAFTLFNVYTLDKAEMASFDWVAANTSQGSRVVLLTGGQPLLDPVSEWFPVFSGRVSVATLFGYEWIDAKGFMQRSDRYNELQTCLYQDLDCVQQWAARNGIQFDYLYVTNRAVHQGSAKGDFHSGLAASIIAQVPGSLVYDAPGVSIFDLRNVP